MRCAPGLCTRLQEVIKHFKLRERVGASPQSYALGIKEVWEVSQPARQAGNG